MCSTCEAEARNVADRLAEANSTRFAGHGRQAHGRDAGRRRQNAEDNRERNIQDAWDSLYEQTYNRLMKERHGGKKN